MVILTSSRFSEFINRDPYEYLSSCDIQTWESFLRWSLDLGGLQKLDSLRTKWRYVQMWYHDKCGRDIDKTIGARFVVVVWYNYNNNHNGRLCTNGRHTHPFPSGNWWWSVTIVDLVKARRADRANNKKQTHSSSQNLPPLPSDVGNNS